MTQGDKDLLLKDLCSRLPYRVKVRGVFLNYNKDNDKILYEECDSELKYQDLKRYESLKPYLRPMTDMTENERWDYEYKRENYTEWEAYDYLNSIHIDYRGLIQMGLALEAPEGMYD